MYTTHIILQLKKSEEKFLNIYKETLKKELEKHGLSDKIGVITNLNKDNFQQNKMTILPDNIMYSCIIVNDIPKIIKEFFVEKKVKADELSFKEIIYDPFKRRVAKEGNKILLANSEIIDPKSIDDYIKKDGYKSLEKTFIKGRAYVLKQIEISKLRGRGGAAFPVIKKWEGALNNKGKKYLVINADEGEPGTFKDRVIMEDDPHRLIEGIIISSYVLGVDKAYIYIRGEYYSSIEKLKIAISQAKEKGLLGKNILNSNFDLEIEIKIGAGSYVCGEETALIESLEGNRGKPRYKPPFPVEKGLWNKPTIVNNVETISNIPTIVKIGGENFSKIGTENCTGTKLFTILGNVNYPCIAEIEFGITLKELIYDFARGMKEGKKFKAALVGGAAGGVLSSKYLDIKLDYDIFKENGFTLGSGAILVMNEDVDLIDILSSIIKFFRHESCGKCIPCTLGTKTLEKYIEKILSKKAIQADLDKMLKVALTMKNVAFCELGKSLYLPIHNIMEDFKEDFNNYLLK